MTTGLVALAMLMRHEYVSYKLQGFKAYVSDPWNLVDMLLPVLYLLYFLTVASFDSER